VTRSTAPRAMAADQPAADQPAADQPAAPRDEQRMRPQGMRDGPRVPDLETNGNILLNFTLGKNRPEYWRKDVRVYHSHVLSPDRRGVPDGPESL